MNVYYFSKYYIIFLYFINYYKISKKHLLLLLYVNHKSNKTICRILMYLWIDAATTVCSRYQVPYAIRRKNASRCRQKKGLNPMIQPLFLGARVFRMPETTPLRSALRLFIPQSTMQIYVCHLYSPAYIQPYNFSSEIRCAFLPVKEIDTVYTLISSFSTSSYSQDMSIGICFEKKLSFFCFPFPVFSRGSS